jgi:hypothetical protein
MKSIDLLAAVLLTLGAWFFLSLFIGSGVAIFLMAIGLEQWLNHSWLKWVIAPVPIILALFSGRFIWKTLQENKDGNFWWAARGAIIVGGLGLVGGVVGPILLAPDSNQGPLLGIIFTGPLGFVIGGTMGLLLRRRGE